MCPQSLLRIWPLFLLYFKKGLRLRYTVIHAGYWIIFFHVLSIQTSAVSHHTLCFLSLITVELFSLLASSTKLWNLITWTYSTCFLCTCLKLFDVLFMCRRIPEALILHEGLLRPCDDYCFFIMKTTTDSIPRWETFKKKKKKSWQWQIFNHNVFCGLCYHHNFYINNFCLLLLPIRVILLLSIWKLEIGNSPTINDLCLRIVVSGFSLQQFWQFWKVVCYEENEFSM